MKVIDLLNKIANGEEVPKKIRLGDKIDIFYYQDCIKSYKTDDNEYLMCEYLCNTDRLNDEVEIIEEDKKIEKIDMFDYFTGYDFDNTSRELREHLEHNFCILNNKINEIIKHLNKGE